MFCLDEIRYTLPQTIDCVGSVFVLGILTTETCWHISHGPRPGISVWGHDIRHLPTDHIEEAPADEVFFNENPINCSQIPDLIGKMYGPIND